MFVDIKGCYVPLGFFVFADLLLRREPPYQQRTDKGQKQTLTTQKKGMTGDGDWNFQSIEGRPPKPTHFRKKNIFRVKIGNVPGIEMKCSQKNEKEILYTYSLYSKLAVSIKSLCLMRPIIKRFAPPQLGCPAGT